MSDTINKRIAKAKGWEPVYVIGRYTGFSLSNGWQHDNRRTCEDWEHEIEDAWRLVEEMSNAKFSKRDRFTKALTEAISQRYRPVGASWSLDWPDAFLRVTPRDIAIAWLAVNEGKG